MKTIRVARAQGMGTFEAPPAVHLEIADEIPDFRSVLAAGTRSYAEAERFFTEQAELVCEALQSLPQGTRHRVLARMLEQAAGVLHVG